MPLVLRAMLRALRTMPHALCTYDVRIARYIVIIVNMCNVHCASCRAHCAPCRAHCASCCAHGAQCCAHCAHKLRALRNALCTSLIYAYRVAVQIKRNTDTENTTKRTNCDMLHCKLQLVLNNICESCTNIATQLKQFIHYSVEMLLQKTQRTCNICEYDNLC